VSSFVDWLVTSLIVGVSLSEVTVRTNVSCAEAVPSVTVNVTTLVPFWFAAGFILTVQFGAVPQIVIFPFGNKVVFEELADNAVAQIKVVSTSLIVTATLFNAVSSGVV